MPPGDNQPEKHPSGRIPSNSPNPERAERVARVSPEGVPAHPDAGPRTIGLLLAALVVFLLAIAVIIAAFFSPMVGILLGGLTLVIFLANPAVWSAILRADEREALVPKDKARSERPSARSTSTQRTNAHAQSSSSS